MVSMDSTASMKLKRVGASVCVNDTRTAKSEFIGTVANLGDMILKIFKKCV